MGTKYETSLPWVWYYYHNNLQEKQMSEGFYLNQTTLLTNCVPETFGKNSSRASQMSQ
jgi:hypothetical protein